jgi:HAD superfamily hydrolase (TIGR01509 family)
MNPNHIQLVCFDLGGVWLRLSDGWQGALRRSGVDPADLRDGFHELLAFREANHRFERGEIEEDEYARCVASITGLTPDDVMAVLLAWLVEPYPGVDTLLDRLDAAGVTTACLSNTNTAHWRVVTTPGPLELPLHRLHHRFASPFVGHRKPDADIYRHVQEQVGVSGRSILFFDDAPENVQAAISHGWRAQRIDPNDDPIAQATEILKSLGVISDD